MLPFIFLAFFWLIRTAKAILFWLYLWQLKEYHIGRFLDHFRTAKGKKLFLNKLVILKTILFFYALIIAIPSRLIPWPLYAVWILILTVFYLSESIKALLGVFQRKLKKPVLTKKTSVLISLSLLFGVSFISLLFLGKLNFYWFSFWLLAFDLMVPFLVSLFVLLLQPFTVYFRSRILKRAKEKMKKFDRLMVIGITGSYGKTSTKEFLSEILYSKYQNKVLKTKEHQNSEIGISRCILNEIGEEHQIFVVEMGAYNQGGINLLSDIVKPKIGILTGINEQHLATFLSQENIIKTKYELIDNLPANGLAIFNGENSYCSELYQKTQKSKRIIKIYQSAPEEKLPKPDVWAEKVEIEKESIYFEVFSTDGDRANFRVNLLGRQNVENILLAACCAKEIGMSLSEISLACQKIRPEQGAAKLIVAEKGLNIIDSSYSANPQGVISHLDYLKIWHHQKIIIMPCLIELGRVSSEVHRKLGKKIGEICNLAIITTKDKLKEIKQGFLDAGRSENDILYIEDPKKIVEKVKSFFHPGDVVLLEGRMPIQLINSLIEQISNEPI